MMRKTILFKGETLSFADSGKGRVVVLLHGFLGSSDIWKVSQQALATSFRVIVPDLPGHGNSSCYGYIHSMELMAKSVKFILDHLKLKRYVIIGHSMGGYVALAFAELFNDHLRGLCLFHSTAYADSEQKKIDRNRAIQLVKQDARVYTKDTIKQLFAAPFAKQQHNHIKFAQEIALNTSRRGIVACLEGMKDRPNRDIILNFARFPILMVIGRHDTVLSVQDLLTQSELIRNKSILLLEDAGHMGFLECPEVVHKTLLKFSRLCFRSLKKRQG